jgi:hypothetical protein
VYAVACGIAYLLTNEHQEIYPICSGLYTVEASVEEVLSDPAGVLDRVSTVNSALQDALAVAQSGNILLIAEGTYTPDTGPSQRPADVTATFEIPNQVTLRGGYAGVTHSTLDKRDINQYLTVLSGDLLQNDPRVREAHDLYTDEGREDNSLHVVTLYQADAATRLEGLTITAGNSYEGAGILLVNSDGNIDAASAFTSAAGPDGIVGTPDDDLSVHSDSAAIDAGNSSAVPQDRDDINGDGNLMECIPLDLAGKARYVDSLSTEDTGVADAPAYPTIVDMGAYEYSE